jgi:hypothetical protein
VNNARGVFSNLYLCAWNGSATLVRHDAVDAAAKVLRTGECGENQRQQYSKKGERPNADSA